MPLAFAAAVAVSPHLLNHHHTAAAPNFHHHHHHSTVKCRAAFSPPKPHQQLLPKPSTLLENLNSSVSLRYASNNVLDDVDDDDDGCEGGGGDSILASALALATAIRKASTSPVEFVQTIETDPKARGLVLPSPDFQRLCLEQFDIFRRTVHPSALLSVYVRPAGSYTGDRLELRRVTFYPSLDGSEIVILVGNFSIPAELRIAEAAISNQEAEAIPEYGALVFPMVKHPFIVGFLVVELPDAEVRKEAHEVKQAVSPSEPYVLPPTRKLNPSEFQLPGDNALKYFNFSNEQRLNAISISRSIAMAYVMDQKELLLQQTTWQNSVRMSNLIEQMRGPLSSIRAFTNMLSVQMKRNEIALDIVEDIAIQGDHIRDTLQLMQDAIYLTKVNILRFNEESLEKLQSSDYAQPRLSGQRTSGDSPSIKSSSERTLREQSRLSAPGRDVEMPMPPLALVALQQHNVRPCNVYDILVDLIGAVELLAHSQRRTIEFNDLSQSLPAVVEEAALRQALGNLIEGALLRTLVGGKVVITCVEAPAGGALVIIDDNGPDMHYMTQMHSLTPFGAELFSGQRVEDNMAWNFIAGITVAREILESYGCVVRVTSPRFMDVGLVAGGTRVEVWLPSVTALSSDRSSAQEA
ncbi:hypothetical protein Drorol1_Dr00008104 [Drosera rotundifolia]